MKKFFIFIFLFLTLCNKGIAESFYFKNCVLSNDHLASYIVDFEKNFIYVKFESKTDGSLQEWADKIELIKKDKISSEKIQSKSGQKYYFQYYLDAKSGSVTRQNYKKFGDFFTLYGPPMKSYCADVKANWFKKQANQEQTGLDEEKKRIEEEEKQKELTLKEEERRKKLKNEKKLKKNIHNILIVSEKWIKLSKYNSSSATQLNSDFDLRAAELCVSTDSFSTIEKNIEIVEMDETPAFGLETVIKIGIRGKIECK